MTEFILKVTLSNLWWELLTVEGTADRLNVFFAEIWHENILYKAQFDDVHAWSGPGAAAHKDQGKSRVFERSRTCHGRHHASLP